MSGSLSERLRAACSDDWEALHEHPFVRELAAGTLPPDAFRFYLEQNLQYLPEYARAMALGASRADDVDTMRVFAAELANVVENEIPENERLLQATIDFGAAQAGGAREMSPATVGYTSFLVAEAARGRPVEIMAAIVPCTWSYGDIASRLAARVRPHPVYADWIRFFGSPEYERIVETMRRDFERIADRAPEVDEERLQWLFATGVCFERRFWDMAYAAPGRSVEADGVVGAEQRRR